MSDILTYLTSSIPISLSETYRDSYPNFVMDAASRAKGTLQPPGPGVDAYEVEWEADERGLNYTLNVKWEPWVKNWLVPSIPHSQVTHRSRLLAVSSNALKVNELNYRLQQTIDNYKAIEQLKLRDRDEYEMFQIVADTTLKYMTIDADWIHSYIKEHEQSSLGGGYKWRQAYEISTNEWASIMQQLKGNMEEILRRPGYWNNINWFSGIRARSEGLKSVVDHYTPPPMERSRIILFHPTMSLWTVFIPQKAAWYKEVLEKTEQLVKPRGEYYYPYVMGGQIYILAQQYFNAGLPFRANDGKSWESSVGILLGKYFRPFMVNFKGIAMLPSGETFTSMYGTMASLLATRGHKGKWLILGDDMNNWDGSPVNLPFIEYQPEDSKYKWILGVRYDIDTSMPRISGIKMSMDRARAMIPMDQTPFTRFSRVVSRKRDPRTRVAWAGLFHGWFGDRSLIDSLAETPPGEYISAGELIERMVEEKITQTDPYGWAESMGVKEVFVSG